MNYKHGLSNTKLYSVWQDMKTRCYYEGKENYNAYGGKGITICDEWLNNFVVFYDWSLANGYTEFLTIERIDNNVGYNPSNCKWIPLKSQYDNRTSNKMFEYQGELKNIKAWSVQFDMSYQMLRKRLVVNNMTVEQAITIPKYKKYKK